MCLAALAPIRAPRAIIDRARAQVAKHLKTERYQRYQTKSAGDVEIEDLWN